MIKGKVEQSREWSSTLPYNCVVGYWKGAFWSPSTNMHENGFVIKKNYNGWYAREPNQIKHARNE